MATRKYSKDRTCRVEIRLTFKERAYVEEQAKNAALTLSEFLRRRAMGKRLVSRFDDRVLNEIRKLGGLQKHLAAKYPAQREKYDYVFGKILAMLEKAG